MSYFQFHDSTKRVVPLRPLRPEGERSRETGLSYVLWDNGLVPAINAAIHLGRPLLLTGEPGTGKSTLADRIAWFLGLEAPLLFLTKSSSVGKDLFYTYDALGRLQAVYAQRETRLGEVQTEGLQLSPANFINFQALGRAILDARQAEFTVNDLQRLRALSPADAEELLMVLRRQRGEQPATQSVVLIDEIDKANRDFPNDLLHELDRMEFQLAELGNLTLSAPRDRELKPIVIITSNSEKSLPEAFLRRCVYYNISFPENLSVLKEIVTGQLQRRRGHIRDAAAQPEPSLSQLFLDDCFAFFRLFREQAPQKKPAIAELVDWVILLLEFGADPQRPLRDADVPFHQSGYALAKSNDDLETLTTVWKDFCQEHGKHS